MKMTALWDVAPCSLVEADRRFFTQGCLMKRSLFILRIVQNNNSLHCVGKIQLFNVEGGQGSSTFSEQGSH
jgi:hypothetical protein